MKNTFKVLIFPILISIVSVLIGILFGDILWGTLSLIFGFLNAYYMAIGKWYNYIFGFLFAVVYAYICTINGLFGLLIFTIIFYLPLQVTGLVNWFKNKQEAEVKMRSLNLKTAIVLCISIVAGSTLLGFLLSLIPGQNLAFLDSTSQIINLCGVVLGTLRFRESWYIWLLNNLVDLSIWIVNTIAHTPNAEMSLVTSIMYLVMNVIGVVSWIILERKQKEKEKLA